MQSVHADVTEQPPTSSATFLKTIPYKVTPFICILIFSEFPEGFAEGGKEDK